MVALLLKLITCYYLANYGMLMLRAGNQEMMTCRDMGQATLGQSGNRDIPRSMCSTMVCTFMHLGVKGSKQRCNTPY